MTEPMGNATDDVDESEDVESEEMDFDDDGDEEDIDDGEEEAKETKAEPPRKPKSKQEQRQVQTEKPRQELRQEKVTSSIDEDAVEMFNNAKQSALLLGVDEKKAEAFAANQALTWKKQLDKVRSQVEAVSDTQFNSTEYGEAYRQLRQAIPSLTKQQVVEFVNFKNKAVMEGSYQSSQRQDDSLDKDAKYIAKLWGIKPDDMKKELKRFNKVSNMNLDDHTKIYELGRIPV